ncbi:hypothetical protein [Ornithinimicrobium kibberense]|uniref:hypothetical protein n=1 Tax=Ornithinimicrobium kibberense TaxID=282060 RepID=UPI003617A189
MAAQPHPADRDRRRPALPRRRGLPAGGRRPDLRHRRARRADLRGDDAGVRAGQRDAAAVHRHAAGADAVAGGALGRPGDPGVCGGGQAAGRLARARGGLQGGRHPRAGRRARGRPHALPRGGAAGDGRRLAGPGPRDRPEGRGRGRGGYGAARPREGARPAEVTPGPAAQRSSATIERAASTTPPSRRVAPSSSGQSVPQPRPPT